jgi:uncharacterized phage protein (TIGR02218 family)
VKVASQATLAILASGQYIKIEFWQITLANGTPYYFTSGDLAPLVVGGNTYVGGLIFVRDQLTTKAGVTVGSLEMTIEPQFDYPGGQPNIAGGTFLSQLRAGVFDNAVWLMSKGFFLPSGSDPVTANGYTYTPPASPYSPMDTSPGLVPWWAGITSKVQAGRFSADVTLDEATAILDNQQMPRNMIQAGCVHQLFDAGCTLNKSQNTYTGALTGSIAGNSAATNLTAAAFVNGYFNLGIITFTSGVLNGASFTVSTSTGPSSASITTILPFPSAPSVGDTFSIVPGCDKTFPTCGSNKFKLPSGSFGSNAAHYRGCPFVPQPETLYDGGTGSQTLSSIGTQGKPGAGSPFTGTGNR